jgi:PAS domain S-box-containing protein
MELKTVKYVKIDDIQGILYSAGKRSLLIPIDFIRAINDIFVKLLGQEGAKFLIYTMGKSLGKGYVQSVESMDKEDGLKLNSKEKIKSACDTIFVESGWGRIDFVELDLEKRYSKIEIQNSPSGKILDSKTFDLERGIVASIFEEVTGSNTFCLVDEIQEDGRALLITTSDAPEEFSDNEEMTLISREELQEKIDFAIEEITHEKEKISSIIESMADGLIMVDNNAVINLANPQIEEYFKVTKENILGKKLNEAGLCDCLYTLFQSTKNNPEKKSMRLKDPIICHSRKDKDIFVQVVCKAVLSKKTDVIGYIIVAHDVTREKRIERLKNEFISISAHQLRTPLAGIKWALRMILDGEIGKVDKEAASYLDKAYQTNEIMICLVNDLLNVTRIEEGRFLLELKPVSLKDLVKKVIMEAEVVSERKNIEVGLKSKKDGLIEIDADPEKLRLALQNLIENAIKYSERGGKVAVSITPKEDRTVLITVKDSGIGIAEKEHKRVFSKFFRGRNATRVQTQGTGLGLFIVKNIIESHNGKIWFKSEINKGTTFYISLPLNKQGKE